MDKVTTPRALEKPQQFKPSHPASSLCAREAAAGDSASRKVSVSQEELRFDEFCKAESYPSFAEMNSAEQLCNPKMLEDYSTWLADGYKIAGGSRNAGKGYNVGSAVNKLNDCLLAIKKKCAKLGLVDDPEHGVAVRAFLGATKPHERSSAYEWFAGIRQKMRRRIFQKFKLAGEKTDQSQVPVYPAQIRSACAAYEAQGSTDAWRRRSALATAMMSCGRSGETAWLHLDSLECDPYMNAVYASCMQSKTSKTKVIALVCGSSRNYCWFDALGARMAMCPPEQQHDQDQADWLHPELQDVKQPNTKLGTYLKHLRPGAAGTYAKYAVKDLPPTATAGGIRAGCITCLSQCMPQEHVAMVSGHELSGVSALYEYLRADRATAMAGATKLAGWQPFEWGKLGRGPVPATLASLASLAGCNVAAL